ncbi:MAG: CvpA family protein [Steroidobacteraceae bacterium]|nr:CvpA family protein [Nevskiaceae bacterium]MCP5339565.1 CvpA family protein [Nevskiaceae bacterium]MCP5359143.1 CvpA family protein [Nevskiaceae bacterium]MCP5466377.1 CvpA family protein [Nevskiaceae bacterium]MCP5471922.1 CvpA family protein [Nevskiaceae bacterium]
MTPVDYVILAIAVASALLGVIRGFLREAISAATWIVALWAAWQHSDFVRPWLGGALAAEPYGTWGARALVVFAVLILGTLVGMLAGQFVRVSLFSGLDRFLGFLFGLLRGVVVIGLAVIVATTLRLDGEPWWKQSKLMPYAEGIGDVVRVVVGDAARTVVGKIAVPGADGTGV